MWWVLSKGRNADKIFSKLVKRALPKEERDKYFTEKNHLFDIMSSRLQPELDARLSFTTSIWYSPHGIEIPAWKAVFFNPKTDKAVVDNIVKSIENL